MKHILLIKLKEGENAAEAAERAREYLSPVAGAIPGYGAVTAHVNCVAREGNFDLMFETEMESRETLEAYVSHEIHKAFIAYMAPKTESKITFDRE